MTGEKTLDVICIGRSSVDLYGEQIGGRLEDMRSFAKYIGGSATNSAIGASRLGLRSALISKVGDEQMGRFIKETLGHEGVDHSQVTVDPERLTALVILGISSQSEFPHIFYRENCADMALGPDDVSEAKIISAKALLVTGTHFSTPLVDAASRKAIRLAKRHDVKVVFDIDYRPVLWGLTGHAAGENRFVANEAITQHMLSIVSDCDVIVGTEEEFSIAGGSEFVAEALKQVRQHTDAALILKTGPDGSMPFVGAIPDIVTDAARVPGFPVEVLNTLGAGDAFMAGFLKGYIDGLPLNEACRLGNACGAIVVSRHGCSPAIPSLVELQTFMEDHRPRGRLDENDALNRLHHSTTGRRELNEILAFAFDHRSQLANLETPEKSIENFKFLCAEVVRKARTAFPDQGLGLLCDDRYGGNVLHTFSDSSLWIGRPIEEPGSRPLEFACGSDISRTLKKWPAHHCVKCLCFYHPDDVPDMKGVQQNALANLYKATRSENLELLLEVIPPKSMPDAPHILPTILAEIYDIGVFPEWWKLPPPASPAIWDEISKVVRANDPYCRGVVILGQGASQADLEASIRTAANHVLCKGFAVGRTIFMDVATQWMSGDLDGETAVSRMMQRYSRLIEIWCESRVNSPKTAVGAL